MAHCFYFFLAFSCKIDTSFVRSVTASILCAQLCSWDVGAVPNCSQRADKVACCIFLSLTLKFAGATFLKEIWKFPFGFWPTHCWLGLLWSAPTHTLDFIAESSDEIPFFPAVAGLGILDFGSARFSFIVGVRFHFVTGALEAPGRGQMHLVSLPPADRNMCSPLQVNLTDCCPSWMGDFMQISCLHRKSEAN